MCALICSPQFLGPFLILDSAGLIFVWGWASQAFFAMISLIALQSLGDLESLFWTAKHIVNLSCWRESAQNLVLWRKIKFLHDLIKLHPQLQIFILQLLEREVLLTYKESQVLRLILRLSNDPLPSKLHSITVFFLPDELEMQVIVLLDQPLVLFLQRNQCLCVQLCLLSDDSVFILKLLESLSRLHHLI